MEEEKFDLIKNLVAEIVEQSKDYYATGRGQQPDYYKGYKKAISNYNVILPHSEFGYFPSKLFQDRAPNQDVKEFEYMKANYQSITLPVFNDYVSTMGRAWHYMNWDIDFAEDKEKYGEETFSKYLYYEYPEFKNFDSFFQNIILPLRAKDAEAVIAIRPKEIPIEVNEETGEARMKEDELLEPIAVVFRCDQVVYKSDDLYILESDEKSLVSYQGKEQRKGRIFEIYTENEIIFAKQVGKLIDWEFEYSVFLIHNAGYPQVVKLGGVPTYYDGKIIYESRFLHAVGNLNLVLLDASYLFASKTKTAFPVRVMVGKPCEHEEAGTRCFNGQLTVYDENTQSSHSRACPKCNGSGLQQRISPTGELLWDPKDFDNANAGYQLLRYEAPNVDTLKFLQEQIDNNTQKALDILHLSKSNDKANVNSESATMSNLENKALMSIIKNNADQEFDIYEAALNMIGYQRYASDFERPTITRPVTFDFTTEEDYLTMISMAVDSGAPPAVVRMIMMKYLRAVYFDSEISGKIFSLLVHADRLLDMSKEEIQYRIAQGHIAPWEDVLHVSGISLIDELMLENPTFLDQEMKVQIEQLKAKAEQKFSEINVSEDVINRVVNGTITGITG